MTRPILAAVAALALAACATVQTAATPASRAASGAYYCHKDKLYTDGDRMVCNWEASAAEACHATSMVSVERARVASEPRNAGRCNNGQWLVEVTTR